MQKISIDSSGVHINSKTYVGNSASLDFSEIGHDQYNGKVYHFKNGKKQIVKASQNVFRIPVVKKVKPKLRISIPNCYDDNGCENCSRKSSCELRKKLLYDTHDDVRFDNILRAISRIQQIILSNDWSYFITITCDDSKLNAADHDLVLKKVSKWLHNLVQRQKVGYLLVPEYHKKDKRIHCHALIFGDLVVTHDDVYAVKGFKKPIKMASIKRLGIPNDNILYPVYNVPGWKYGFSTAIKVYGSPARLANYVTKYITKDITKIFGKHYWVSKNLKIYPDIELYSLAPGEYDETIAKEYYHRGSAASFKYINKTGDVIQDDCDDELVLDV